MARGTANNESFWRTEGARDFYGLDNAEKVVLHPFIAEIINQMNPKALLDFGCGDGYLSTLIDPSTEVHLYDSNSDFVNRLVVEKDDRVDVPDGRWKKLKVALGVTRKTDAYGRRKLTAERWAAAREALRATR